MTSQRFDYEDKKAKETIEHVEAFTMEKTLGLMEGVSYAKYLPPFNGIYNNVRNHMIKFKNDLLYFSSLQ